MEHTPEFKEVILQRLRNGEGATKIALELNVASRTVQKWKAQANIKTNRRGHNKKPDSVLQEAIRRRDAGQESIKAIAQSLGVSDGYVRYAGNRKPKRQVSDAATTAHASNPVTVLLHKGIDELHASIRNGHRITYADTLFIQAFELARGG